MRRFKRWISSCATASISTIILLSVHAQAEERQCINEDWRFTQNDPQGYEGSLIYDLRPEVNNTDDTGPADAKPTEAQALDSEGQSVLKPWILPTGNAFIKDPTRRHVRPEGNPGADAPYVQTDFDDSNWEAIDLPHDWAIAGPFFKGDEGVGGGMGRLPSPGIGWYRKTLDIPTTDAGKRIFLDIDGAMSYAMVWLNGKLVGGWPFGYSSFRLDLTPFILPGEKNQLAIRLDNPPNSSRWYPGGGIYRKVCLVKTSPVHVGHWGTYITTPEVSTHSASVELSIQVDNDSDKDAQVDVLTEIFETDAEGQPQGTPVAVLEMPSKTVQAASSITLQGTAIIYQPKLWEPLPSENQHRYLAITRIKQDDACVDTYETPFGVRSLRFDPDWGIYVNGEHVEIQGVNQHHDLGALGAAYNQRAAERQLEILEEMGCNAIRLAHNPPAPELLDLCDRMGFLVVDESFDCWERKKTPLDFHLIFPDWHEQDMRAMVRRDRNHPSIIMWSIGNEVGEQYTDEEGAAIAQRLSDIVHEEDPTRPTTASMNWAKPDMPFPGALDLVSLNYQGEGIRQDPMFEGVNRIRTAPQYEPYKERHPDKVILTSESASALSTRGTYLFPVTDRVSAPIGTGQGEGGNPTKQQVSAYELYAVDFGSSPDKVFAAQDKHPFVAGEFVWTGWDYIGEPTPYYGARSSYSGIIDLAGFKKDRFYLYQARWRPELPMAHLLPHWSWPERVGKVTPVHVFTSGDEAELFLNGKSLGRKKRGDYEYRLRWDDVVYEPGTLKVVAYKDGEVWADDEVKTAEAPAKLSMEADRSTIAADGLDLAFVTVKVEDLNGLTAPRADNEIHFSLEGPGEIVATDNGDPADLVAFPSHSRKAYSGLCLVIVKADPDSDPGEIVLKAAADGLEPSTIVIRTK